MLITPSLDPRNAYMQGYRSKHQTTMPLVLFCIEQGYLSVKELNEELLVGVFKPNSKPLTKGRGLRNNG